MRLQIEVTHDDDIQSETSLLWMSPTTTKITSTVLVIQYSLQQSIYAQKRGRNFHGFFPSWKKPMKVSPSFVDVYTVLCCKLYWMTNTVEVIFVVVGDIQSNDSKHSVITELPLHCHKLNQLNPFQGIYLVVTVSF